ncbi:gamma-glutamyl hydrolase 2-like isoform X2 [Olea europaea var. sylvestris]|uniref:gamma-glutamyl hydrolase 2-like isoform X2 n=1 Tax=Olea europaea var. sylvestris TaxID=158386 RepID=UPI000C1D8147|nr:gamma-glutamyl hydrolase 2-like isoform X2 [Olea europaea var. sylvestris]
MAQQSPPPPPPPTISATTSSAISSSSNTTSPRPYLVPSVISSSASSDMLNYLWVALLIALSKELTAAANAQSDVPLLLPSESDAFPRIQRCPAADPRLNYRPVIGILSHPGDGASGRLNNATNASYIAASYVKFVESAGARVIPLIYNEPRKILYEKLNLVNGMLFTGGWAKSGLYFEVVESIFKDNNILEKFNAADQASTLQFTRNIDINGTVFQRFPPALLKKLSTDCLVMQNHHYGISPEKFLKDGKLCSFFEILTTSEDTDNKVYVSTVKAHRYPVTAVQWHPEKNAFEWGLSMIPHSDDAIQVTQHVANYFIGEARKSMNRPCARKVLDNLIYNYSPTYCGKAGKGYDEVYIFA